MTSKHTLASQTKRNVKRWCFPSCPNGFILLFFIACRNLMWIFCYDGGGGGGRPGASSTRKPAAAAAWQRQQQHHHPPSASGAASSQQQHHQHHHHTRNVNRAKNVDLPPPQNIYSPVMQIKTKNDLYIRWNSSNIRLHSGFEFVKYFLIYIKLIS